MKLSTLVLGGLLVGGTLVAGAATLAKIGVPRAEEPQGLSLRQESTQSQRGFFYGYYARAHRGGGLRGGK